MGRRKSIRVTRSVWECSYDGPVAEILHRLRQEFEDKYTKNVISEFVTRVIEREDASEIKLRLYRYILDRDVLRSLHNYGQSGLKQYDRLEKAYRTLFDEWWQDQIRRIERSYPKLTERLTALELMKAEHPDKMQFSYRIKKDFDIAISALMQRTELAIENEKENDKAGKGLVDEEVVFPVGHAIEWIENNNLLMDLFKTLGRLGMISPLSVEKRAELIVAHFVDKKGEKFKKESLIELERQTRSNNSRHHEGRPKRGLVVEHELERVLELQSIEH